VLLLSHVRARLDCVWRVAGCSRFTFVGTPLLITAGISAMALGISQGAFAQTPATPTGLAITGGTSQLTSTWTNVTGLIYNIYQWPAGSTEPTTPSFTGKTSPFTSTGLTNGTQYYTKISGVNSSSVEGPKTAYIAAVPIAQPTGVTAKAGNGIVTLSWGAATGAFRYSVYRATTSGSETLVASDISTLSYTDTGRTNGTTYYYKVSGVRQDSTVIALTESTLSSEVSATPLATLPAAPSGLAAVPGNAQVLLSWSAVSGATSYKIYRSLNQSGGPYTLVTSPTSTSYTDTGAINGTTINPRTYYYVVSAVNGVGEGAYSNEAAAQPGASGSAGVMLFSTADTTAVSSQPTAIYGYHNLMYAWNGASSTYVTYVKFDLSGVSGTVTGATLSIYGFSNGASATNVSVSPVADTTWTEAGLNWNTRPTVGTALTSISVPTTEAYQNWDVSSYIHSEQLAGHTQVTLALTQDSVGTIIGNLRARESGALPRLTLITSGPTEPSGLTATGGLGQVSLAWNSVPGATSYSVKRALVTGGPYTTIATGVTATTYTNTGLGDGTTYYYVVSATNSTGEGANSAQASATTNTVTTPRNLAVTPGDQQTLLTWTPVAGQGYNVYRSDSGGSFALVNTDAPITVNGYNDTSVTNGTAYSYKVTYVNSSAVESTQTSAVSATPIVQDGTWTINAVTTNTSGSPSASTAPILTASSSQGTTLTALATINGVTTGTATASSEASYSGTYTVTWVPNTSTSWPTLYALQHMLTRMNMTLIDSGSGASSIAATGGSTLIHSNWPNSDTMLVNAPADVLTFDTSNVNHVIQVFTTSLSSQYPTYTSGTQTGWCEATRNGTTSIDFYTQAYFQTNFATPSAIHFTIVVPNIDLTASASLTGTSASSTSLAQASAFDNVTGQ
jgi:fibronectin type 3 domain-containing protein